MARVDARDFFSIRHRRMHEMDGFLGGLSDAQARARPRPGLNSVAWLLWHVARTEDVGANALVAGGPQTLDDGDWPARLRVARRDIGTGMTNEEVGVLSDAVDLAALRGYWDAVGRRTTEVVRALLPADLDAPVDDARVRRVFVDDGAFAPAAGWVFESRMYHGQSAGFFLAHFALTHSYVHYGEAGVVRGLLGIPGR